MGTGDAVTMSTAHLRHVGQVSRGPTGVEPQSKSSMRFFISLIVEGGIAGAANGVRGGRRDVRIVFLILHRLRGLFRIGVGASKPEPTTHS